MAPDKFNMVDMGGIDLILMQEEEVEGLYDKLVESITQCRYQCLYNWYFDDVLIPPTYVSMSIEENSVVINSGITVDSDDIIHIYSLEYPPVVAPLSVTENGDYEVPQDVDGFNPVSVNVQPTIESLSVTENGTYTVPENVDGFDPVTVNVPQPAPTIQALSVTENGTYTAPTGVDGYSPVTVNVAGGDFPWDIHFGPNGLSDENGISWVDDISDISMVCNDWGNCYIQNGKLVVPELRRISFPVSKSYAIYRIKCSIDANFVPLNATEWYNQSTIFGKEMSGKQQDFGVTINPNKKISIGYDTSSYASSSVNITDGVEHDIMLVVAKSSYMVLNLLVDGILVARAYSWASGSEISSLGIFGNDENINKGVTGEISEVYVKYL